ncbi:hypothetical protein C8R47DRAFT_1215285 [Mycena vitilis]|nr:hypothetical protein C8R47DRAFT_1215285 [Mycena vitilis]
MSDNENIEQNENIERSDCASPLHVGPTEPKTWEVVVYNGKPSYAVPKSESNTWEVVVASNKDQWLVPKVESSPFPKISWVIPKLDVHSLQRGERYANMDMNLASALRRRYAEGERVDGERVENAWSWTMARAERWEEELHLRWEEARRRAACIAILSADVKAKL